MPTFIGFNTIGQNKKFTLTDFDLIKRDLLNALNIQQGQLPGRPQYGTTVWSYIFENQTVEVEQNITKEIQRVITSDPRVNVVDIVFFPLINGMRIEISVQIVPSTSVEQLALVFDQQSGRATYD
jgi:phage baseplate assembly protein W